MSFWSDLGDRVAREVADRVITSIDKIKVHQTVKPQPQQCFVCGGKGFVPPGFYPVRPMMMSTSVFDLTGEQRCRACEGTGVVR